MKGITEHQLKEFSDFVNGHSFFYVAGHKEPDGDCISSCLGVRAILEKHEKQYQLLSAGPFKRNEIQEYKSLFSNEMDFLSEAERKETGLIIVDCSELSRLGEIDGDLENLDTFIIDHHKTSGCPESAKAIIEPESPAAALLVQILYEKLCGKIDKKLAEELFLGIMTDTGFFRFLSEKDSDALVLISHLIEAGANPKKTYDKINSGKPYSTRKLLGILLDHAELHLDGKLSLTYETMDDTHRFGQEGRDSDLLYQALLSTKGVEAAAFIRQETENTCTAGFRSRDKVDVSSVAKKFGGGGHKNAAGVSCEGRLESLIPAIIKEFARIM